MWCVEPRPGQGLTDPSIVQYSPQKSSFFPIRNSRRFAENEVFSLERRWKILETFEIR